MVRAILAVLIGVSIGIHAHAGEELIYCEHRSPNGSDPISKLVMKLESSPVWRNGRFPNLDLPKTATVNELLPVLFESIGFDEGRIQAFHIIETRDVRICESESEYVAVLMETDLGMKVALFTYEEALHGWWSRVFNSAPSA